MNPRIEDTAESEIMAEAIREMGEQFKQPTRAYIKREAKKLAQDMQAEMDKHPEVDFYVQTATGAAYPIWRK